MRPHFIKPDRDVRVHEQGRDKLGPNAYADHLSRECCPADREPVARAKRLDELTKRIRRELARQDGSHAPREMMSEEDRVWLRECFKRHPKMDRSLIDDTPPPTKRARGITVAAVARAARVGYDTTRSILKGMTQGRRPAEVARVQRAAERIGYLDQVSP